MKNILFTVLCILFLNGVSFGQININTEGTNKFTYSIVYSINNNLVESWNYCFSEDAVVKVQNKEVPVAIFRDQIFNSDNQTKITEVIQSQNDGWKIYLIIADEKSGVKKQIWDFEYDQDLAKIRKLTVSDID